jgi:hypothetical protein
MDYFPLSFLTLPEIVSHCLFIGEKCMLSAGEQQLKGPVRPLMRDPARTAVPTSTAQLCVHLPIFPP